MALQPTTNHENLFSRQTLMPLRGATKNENKQQVYFRNIGFYQVS